MRADKDLIWKEKYEWLVDNLNTHETNARILLADYKSEGLTVGAIEAEGYLRSAIKVSNIVRYIEEVSSVEL